MTLIDSVDSIIMLYSYSGFPDRSWRLFEKREPVVHKQALLVDSDSAQATGRARVSSNASSKASIHTTNIQQVPAMPADVNRTSLSKDSDKKIVIIEADVDDIEVAENDSTLR